MKNIKIDRSGNTLTLTIDTTTSHGRSKSGKNTIIASSEGNVPIPGTDLKLGLNIYK